MTAPQNTATLDIVISVQGTGLNSTFRLSTYNPISIADSPGGALASVVLATGANTVVVPKSIDGQKAQFLLALPDPASTNTKFVQGISGDTGVPFTGQPFLIPIKSGTTALQINATLGETISAIWI